MRRESQPPTAVGPSSAAPRTGRRGRPVVLESVAGVRGGCLDGLVSAWDELELEVAALIQAHGPYTSQMV